MLSLAFKLITIVLASEITKKILSLQLLLKKNSKTIASDVWNE